MAQLQIFRRDLISRFFLIPRNLRNLIPLKYWLEYNVLAARTNFMNLYKDQV